MVIIQNSEQIIGTGGVVESIHTGENGILQQREPYDKEKRRSYKMVVLDLDGTLLHSVNNKHVSLEQAGYLRYLRSKGFHVCLATGRAASSAYPIVESLKFTHPVPVLCSNGAHGFLCGPSSNSTINERLEGNYGGISNQQQQKQQTEDLFFFPIPKQAVKRIWQLAIQRGDDMLYFSKDEKIYATSHHTMGDSEKHAKLLKRTKLLDDGQSGSVSIESLLDDPSSVPSKIMILVPQSKKEPQSNLIRDYDHCLTNEGDLTGEQKVADEERATITPGIFEWFIEITHRRGDKAHGLQTLLRSHETFDGISIDNCIAMGDGPNDMELLRSVGNGVAMKNAIDKLKAVANETMEWTNNENGVMKYLRKVELQGQLCV